jgi:hypothetical protein
MVFGTQRCGERGHLQMIRRNTTTTTTQKIAHEFGQSFGSAIGLEPIQPHVHWENDYSSC